MRISGRKRTTTKPVRQSLLHQEAARKSPIYIPQECAGSDQGVGGSSEISLKSDTKRSCGLSGEQR